jgi:hypothetical protein
MSYRLGQVLGGAAGVGYGAPIQQYPDKESARLPEIMRYAEELEKLLQGCVCSIENLEGRVSPVSRCDPPQPTGKDADCTATSAPQTTHGQRLAGMCEVARMVLNRIDGMARRLEV